MTNWKHNVWKVLFHQPTLMHNILYSLTICLLHYYPRHVSSINMPIFRRKNYIHTASGIFALCKCLQSILVESGFRGVRSQSRMALYAILLLSSQLHKVYQSRSTAKNSWWWTERLPETCRVVIPIKLDFGASVGFIHKEHVSSPWRWCEIHRNMWENFGIVMY